MEALKDQLKERLGQIDAARDQLLANLNATNGARNEVLRLIAQLEAPDTSLYPPPPEEVAKVKRGPKPGTRRKKNGAFNTEVVNDLPRPAEVSEA